MIGGRQRIVCVGEAMIELAPRGGAWDVGYGGDTLNQACTMVGAKGSLPRTVR